MAEPALCSLVLDDDVLLLTMYRALLESSTPGFRVFTAETSDQALEMATGRKFDLVVTDLAHPGKLDGLQFITAMKQIHPSVPIIMVSGAPREDAQILKRRALGLGACAYVIKPFTAETFLKAVGHALSGLGTTG